MIIIIEKITFQCHYYGKEANDQRFSLQWRQNVHDRVSNHQPHDCLLNRLFRRKSKKTSKLLVTGLCAGNSPGTGEFPAQMASNAEMFPFDDVIMLWRVINLDRCLCDHVTILTTLLHYDARQWKRFPRCRPFVMGIHRSQVDSLHKGPVTLMFSLILA